MYERIEAEESLIGCLLSDNNSIEKVYGILSPEMFESSVLSRAYYEYRKAFDENRKLTFSELQQNLESAGIPKYEVEDAIRNAAMKPVFAWQIEGTANAIINHYKKKTVETILGRAELTESGIGDQIEGLIGELENLRLDDNGNGQTVSEIAKQYENDYFCDNDNSLILLGEDEIDRMTGGFQNGDLVIVGARPGIGKSALAAQWAWIFASNGLKVGYYNCEMQTKSVYERLVASKSGIEITRIRLAKKFLNNEEERYRKAVEELTKQENIIIFSGAKKVSEIRNDCRKYKFNVVIVDYVQLLIPDSRYQGNRTAEVGEISRALKNVAMDLDTVVIGLTQLNRSSEGRQNKEPMMSEIRESGSIEQDASIIFLMWSSDENDASKKILKVEKSRNGITGKVDMIFDGSHMSFHLAKEVSPFDGR